MYDSIEVLINLRLIYVIKNHRIQKGYELANTNYKPCTFHHNHSHVASRIITSIKKLPPTLGFVRIRLILN